MRKQNWFLFFALFVCYHPNIPTTQTLFFPQLFNLPVKPIIFILILSVYVYVCTNSLSPCVLVILLDISLLEAGCVCGCLDHFSSIFLCVLELVVLCTCSPGSEVGSIPEVGGGMNICELVPLPSDTPQSPEPVSPQTAPHCCQSLEQSLRFCPMVSDPSSEPALPALQPFPAHPAWLHPWVKLIIVRNRALETSREISAMNLSRLERWAQYLELLVLKMWFMVVSTGDSAKSGKNFDFCTVFLVYFWWHCANSWGLCCWQAKNVCLVILWVTADSQHLNLV